MEIVAGNIESFVESNPFSFYIVDHFSLKFVPRSLIGFVVKDLCFDDLVDLSRTYAAHRGEIVAIGAGGVHDPAKYLATNFEKSLTVIPTALSTNSFATNRSSFLKYGSKVSMTTKTPDRALVDISTLSGAGVLNYFGLIETAATSTAQVDWKLSNDAGKDKFIEQIAEQSSKLVERTIWLLERHESLSIHLTDLLENLIESGLLTIAFGTGRPVSGSEHIISARIENLLHCPHGAGLYIGIQIASRLQKECGILDNNSARVCELLENLNIVKEYVREFLTEENVRESLTHVKPREGRYTVLDMVSQENLNRAITSACDSIYRT